MKKYLLLASLWMVAFSPVAAQDMTESKSRSELKRERTTQQFDESVVTKPVVAHAKAKSKVKVKAKSKAKSKVKTSTTKTSQRPYEVLPVISFADSSDAVPSSQSDYLAQVAAYLRNRPRAKLVIHGTQARSQAVSDMLARRYGVVASRLSVSVESNAKAVTFTEK